jgi:tripeptide aminopeptidase
MNRKRLLTTFMDLLKIESPSGREGKIAKYVAKIMRDCGFSIRKDNAGRQFGGNCGNMVAKLPGRDDSLPGLIFVSHMDTVVPNPGLCIVSDGTTLKTDGKTILGADDKAGVAIMCELARELSRNRFPHRPVEFLFSIAEERGLLGLKNLDFSMLTGKMAFVLDSNTPVGSIVTSAPSAMQVTATVHGKAAHAGVEPEKGINSIAIASAAIASMRIGRIDDETTANIGIINGGSATNIVPQRTVVKGEARSFSETKLQRQVAHMSEQFTKHTHKRGGRVKIETEHEFTTFTVAPEEPIVELALACARRIKRRTSIQKSGGGSDSNVLNEHGIRSVILGMGYKNPHTENESIPIANLYAAAEWVVEIVRQSPKFFGRI